MCKHKNFEDFFLQKCTNALLNFACFTSQISGSKTSQLKSDTCSLKRIHDCIFMKLSSLTKFSFLKNFCVFMVTPTNKPLVVEMTFFVM